MESILIPIKQSIKVWTKGKKIVEIHHISSLHKSFQITIIDNTPYFRHRDGMLFEIDFPVEKLKTILRCNIKEENKEE